MAMATRSSSFTQFLSSYDPGLLPLAKLGPLAVGPGGADVIKNLPHATTIIAASCEGGVVMAGDRRATAGNMISKRDVDKVFRADEYSAIAIAGVLAMALTPSGCSASSLSTTKRWRAAPSTLEGKANRLGKMVRDNLPAAMQGLAMIPLFAGYDEDAGSGRIFSYDVAGGPYEEHRFHSIGSGSVFAKSALKKYYFDDMPITDASWPACRRCTTRLTTTPPPAVLTCPGRSSRWSPRSPGKAYPSARQRVRRVRATGRGRPDALARRPVCPAADGQLAANGNHAPVRENQIFMPNGSVLPASGRIAAAVRQRGAMPNKCR